MQYVIFINNKRIFFANFGIFCTLGKEDVVRVRETYADAGSNAKLRASRKIFGTQGVKTPSSWCERLCSTWVQGGICIPPLILFIGGRCILHARSRAYVWVMYKRPLKSLYFAGRGLSESRSPCAIDESAHVCHLVIYYSDVAVRKDLSCR